MYDGAGHTRALLLIRMAAERIRIAYVDGSLEPATATEVDRSLAGLERLGQTAVDHVEDALRVGAIQLVAARHAGGERAAEVQAELTGSLFAAWTILLDRERTGDPDGVAG
jgi:hypothetical protein